MKRYNFRWKTEQQKTKKALRKQDMATAFWLLVVFVVIVASGYKAGI